MNGLPERTPERIENEEILDEVITRPDERVIELMKRLDGDIIVPGIGGKIGVHLGMMAKRAIDLAGVRKKVYGVSRFSNPRAERKLQSAGIETIRCDLLDPDATAALPNVPNVVFMAGRKFGTSDNNALTWAMNTIVPANVARSFSDSRIVVFSTGCVYDLVPVVSGGATEETETVPPGEYANSTIGRERIFQYYSSVHGTAALLFRLNYSIDLRYGVLREIGLKVYGNRPVDVSMGHVNVIWQGDVVRQALLSLELCSSPPAILNITGPETVPVARIAERFGEYFGGTPEIIGVPAATALLSNASKAAGYFGYPSVPLETMIRWNAGWIAAGGASLESDTHFEVRDGKF